MLAKFVFINNQPQLQWLHISLAWPTSLVYELQIYFVIVFPALSFPIHSIFVTVYRKTGHNAAPFEKIFFLHLQSCRRPDIELLKFYRRSLSRSH